MRLGVINFIHAYLSKLNSIYTIWSYPTGTQSRFNDVETENYVEKANEE